MNMLRARRHVRIYAVGIVGAGGALLVALDQADEPRWTAPVLILSFTLLYLFSAIVETNSSYRIGYSRGMAIALRRATKGIMGASDGKPVKVQANTPDIWEDDLAIEEVQRSTMTLFEMVDDDQPYAGSERAR